MRASSQTSAAVGLRMGNRRSDAGLGHDPAVGDGLLQSGVVAGVLLGVGDREVAIAWSNTSPLPR